MDRVGTAGRTCVTARDAGPFTPASVTPLPQLNGYAGKDFVVYFRDDFAKLVALAASITGDTVWAEDLVQDAMAKASDRWDEVSALDKPGAWVRRVVINLAISRRQRAGREGRALLKLASPRETTFTSEQESPIFALVAELPAQQRTAISLRYVDDLAVNEIADIMQLAPGTVRTHLDHARQALRHQMENHND